jgi:AraC-like DNA-binding protein
MLAESPIGSVVAAGAMRKESAQDWPYMRILGKYALVLLRAGAGFYEDLQHGRVRLRAGAVLLLTPDVGHRYGPELAGDVWDERWVIFSGPVFDLWRRRGVLPVARPVLTVDAPSAWAARLEALLVSARTTAPERQLDVVIAFQQYLADLLAAGDANAGEPPPAWLREACRLMAEAGTVDVDLRDIAASVGMGYESFRKQFRVRAGKSPGRYLSQVVINQACEQLYAGERSIKEIAAALGFCNEFHFSRRFKQLTGQAPSHFSRRVRATRPA